MSILRREVQAIAQTPDGYLWVGTAAGLLRFDGVRTVAWTELGYPPLPAPNVTSLLAAGDRTLWIGTVERLVRWRAGLLGSEPQLLHLPRVERS